MALKLRKSVVAKPTDEQDSEEGPNDHLGEEPIDAPVGYAPRVVKTPMHNNADVNPEVHEAKQEAKREAKNAAAAVEKGLRKIRSDGLSVPRTSEGTRGGSVISRTSNNRPVYATSQRRSRITPDGLSVPRVRKTRSRVHKGITMTNEVSDLFKSELGDNTDKPLTNCVHCNTALSKSDLRKGALGTHFVADDNDNPHDGSETGQIEPSRGVPGVSENDVIAPMLKGLKGPDAGDGEEFPISKSEMATMGMNTDKLDDGWYTITKSEMKKQGVGDHIAYLEYRKNTVAKGLPDVSRAKMAVKDGKISGPSNSSMGPGGKHYTREPRSHGNPSEAAGTAGVAGSPNGPQPQAVRKSTATTDGPHGYSPRAGGVHGPGGEQLVSWSQGSDAEVAKFIETSGGFGPGTDESIRTQGRGH